MITKLLMAAFALTVTTSAQAFEMDCIQKSDGPNGYTVDIAIGDGQAYIRQSAINARYAVIAGHLVDAKYSARLQEPEISCLQNENGSITEILVKDDVLQIFRTHPNVRIAPQQYEYVRR